MHIVVGKLTAVYSGRSETELSPYDRIVIVKSDGTVSIHSDKGFKPLNYMATSTPLQEDHDDEGNRRWTFKSKKESLVVTFLEVYDEINLPLGNGDPGHVVKDGSESQLQEWLSLHISTLDPTLSFVTREYQTGAGPVDILAEDSSEALVAVEVKRTAAMTTVGQVLRYVDALEELHPDRKVRGCIVAVEFKGKTLEIASKKNVLCLSVPSDWLALSLEEKDPVLVERAALFQL